VDALVNLAVKEAESNVKLIVLSKLLEDVMQSFPELLETSVMELLRILENPDPTVRNQCLKLIASGTTGRTAQEVVQFLRKELSKADGNVEYRKDLLEALHGLANRFAEVAPEVMNSYLDVLKSGSSTVSESLVAYIKEGLFRYPRLRQVYLSSVIKALPGVTDSRAIRNLLWVLGEFCDEPGSIGAALASISACLGELPMLAAEERNEASIKAVDQGEAVEVVSAHRPVAARGPRVLADGTYASESAMTCAQNDTLSSKDSRLLPNIKKLFLEGKFECSGVLVNALTKLVIRLEALASPDLESHRARALLIMTSILRLGASKYPSSSIDQDSVERVAFAIQILLASPGDDGDLKRALTAESEAAFNAVMAQGSQHSGLSGGTVPEIDAVIDFGFVSAKPRHGSRKTDASRGQAASPSLSDLLLNGSGNKGLSILQTEPTAAMGVPGSKLNKVVQLTGFSDPVYAETYVHVSGKEIYLDMLLVNQTEETLQGVSVELSCAGDLKLVEKPTPLTLPPFGFTTGKAVFRVTATNHGQIFGCISFLSGATGLDAETVILGEVRIDVLEYIHAASIEEPCFRDAWVLLEWENKISIKVPMRRPGCWEEGLRGFLKYIAEAGHLTPITPNAGQDGPEATFLACNLYAKSIFDEEILANVCLESRGAVGENGEKGETASWITGHLRLRSRTQGLAIAFGDKLNALIHSK
jgi:coatomer subunit beta